LQHREHLQPEVTARELSGRHQVGATFYLEPVATFDVDIFVTFAQEPGSLLLNPQPLYELLVNRHDLLAQWRQFERQFLQP
jgi:hypothetical protein